MIRAALERWINSIWYQGKAVPWYLSALEPLYQKLQRKRAQVQAQELPVPVVIVGNLTAGGTGKTPLVIALVQQMQAAGIKVGVISRGFGRRSKDLRMVQFDSDWREVGDEPLLIHRRTGAPVCVAADRLAAARALESQCQVLVADDGLQHHALPRCAEILVIDGQRGFGNQRLIPAGPLRESSANYQNRFTLRVVTEGDFQDEHAWRLRLLGDRLKRLDGKAETSLDAFRGQVVRALAGIGNPDRFYQSLRSAGLQVEPIPVADHGIATLTQIGPPIVMTEKDALKYAPNAYSWYLPVSAELIAPVPSQTEELYQALGPVLRPALGPALRLASDHK